MSWYKTGTIAVTNGSPTVTGTGSAWIANAGPGEAVIGPDGKLYEILSINSDLSLTLASNYLGTTTSGQGYTIVPSQSYIRDLAAQAATLVNAYSAIVSGAGAGKFGDGSIAAPGVSFIADLDTGLARTASGTIAVACNGINRLDISPTGIVVAGTVTATGAATAPDNGHRQG